MCLIHARNSNSCLNATNATEIMDGACLLAFVIISLATRAESRRVSNTTCGVSAAFYKVADNSALDTNPFLESFVKSMMECVDLCIETHPCRAFLLRKVHNKKYHCHLLQHDHMSEGVKIISKDGWMLFDTGSEDTNREVFMPGRGGGYYTYFGYGDVPSERVLNFTTLV